MSNPEDDVTEAVRFIVRPVPVTAPEIDLAGYNDSLSWDEALALTEDVNWTALE
jgi:hypothetical protein